ncbi:hypothetical protein AC1031_003536 [Aphanomyces cochlioides]|nr:hypothetical protein AC1031_003536 [Aphanomyces cochlioides]
MHSPSASGASAFVYRGSSSDRVGQAFRGLDGQFYVKLYAAKSTGGCRHCSVTCRITRRGCSLDPTHGREGRKVYDVDEDDCDEWPPREKSPRRSPSQSSIRSYEPVAEAVSDLEQRRREVASTLMLNAVPDEVTRSELLRLFSKHFGAVYMVRLPHDFYSGVRRGFGFVEYFDEQAVLRTMRGRRRLSVAVNGRRITIQRAKYPRSTPEEMHARNAHRRQRLLRLE